MMRPAMAVAQDCYRTPVVLCGALRVRTKILSTKNWNASTDSRSHGEEWGNVFLLDIGDSSGRLRSDFPILLNTLFVRSRVADDSAIGAPKQITSFLR